MRYIWNKDFYPTEHKVYNVIASTWCKFTIEEYLIGIYFIILLTRRMIAIDIVNLINLFCFPFSPLLYIYNGI
jgi:hypothetical protein